MPTLPDNPIRNLAAQIRLGLLWPLMNSDMLQVQIENAFGIARRTFHRRRASLWPFPKTVICRCQLLALCHIFLGTEFLCPFWTKCEDHLESRPDLKAGCGSMVFTPRPLSLALSHERVSSAPPSQLFTKFSVFCLQSFLCFLVTWGRYRKEIKFLT